MEKLIKKLEQNTEMIKAIMLENEVLTALIEKIKNEEISD